MSSRQKRYSPLDRYDGTLFFISSDRSYTGIGFPGESQGILRKKSEWSHMSVASISIGYEVAVTVLQIASAYAAIANGGVLLKPRLVKQIINENGDWVAIPETMFEAGSHFIQLAIKPNVDEQETDRLSLTVVTEPINQNPSKLTSKLNTDEALQLTPETKSTPTLQSQDSVIADLAIVIDIEENKQEKPLVVFVPKSDSSIPIIVQSPNQFSKSEATIAVSYTHLTLPTKRIV